jgi:hypothetical protein
MAIRREIFHIQNALGKKNHIDMVDKTKHFWQKFNLETILQFILCLFDLIQILELTIKNKKTFFIK